LGKLGPTRGIVQPRVGVCRRVWRALAVGIVITETLAGMKR
jgi:hypothetical protein